MSWSILPVVFFGAFALPLVLLRRQTIRQGKAVANHFNGRFQQPFADAIIFHYRSRLFSLRRMASKGGLGGTGSYPALCAFLQHETDLVIALESARPILYVGDFPSGHRHLLAGSRKVAIVSKSADLLDRVEQLFTSDPAAAQALSALFVKDFSYLRSHSEIQVGGPCLFKKRHRLMLVGLPDAIYQEPHQLEVALENLVHLSDRLNLPLLSD